MTTYRERTEGVVTNTKLEDFLYCQQLYKLKWIDGVETEDPDEDEPDWAIIGTAYDLYMQSVEKFNEVYEIVPKKTGKSLKIELTNTQGKLIRRMAKEMIRQDFYNSVGEKQYNVQYQYNEHIRLSGTLDEFQKSRKLIIDDKTAAGLRRFQESREKYRGQLAFYQYLTWMTHQILCDGLIRMVTKEKISHSHFYVCEAETLKREWQRMINGLEELTQCIKKDEWLPQPREKCLECPAYASCEFSIQKELIIL